MHMTRVLYFAAALPLADCRKSAASLLQLPHQSLTLTNFNGEEIKIRSYDGAWSEKAKADDESSAMLQVNQMVNQATSATDCDTVVYHCPTFDVASWTGQTYQTMSEQFDQCCSDGGHPEPTCNAIVAEAFKHHPLDGSIPTSGPAPALCDTLKVLVDAHYAWVADVPAADTLMQVEGNTESQLDTSQLQSVSWYLEDIPSLKLLRVAHSVLVVETQHRSFRVELGADGQVDITPGKSDGEQLAKAEGSAVMADTLVTLLKFAPKNDGIYDIVSNNCHHLVQAIWEKAVGEAPPLPNARFHAFLTMIMPDSVRHNHFNKHFNTPAGANLR